MNDEQKIFILTNVCDIMLADGVIEAAEEIVFQNMRIAFGYTEEEFVPFRVAVSAKNIKTFDTDKFTYTRESRTSDDSDFDDIFSRPGISFSGSSNGTGLVAAPGQFGSSVSRAMRANIVKVSSNFGSAKKLNRLSQNSSFHATDASNRSGPQFKESTTDTAQGPLFDTAPSQAPTRRPIGSAGRGQATDPRLPRALPGAHGEAQNLESGTGSPAAHHPVPAMPSEEARHRPAHRPRRAHVASHKRSTPAQRAAELEQVRHRLQKSHKANAEIRKQLDHYDQTGKLVHVVTDVPQRVAETTSTAAPLQQTVPVAKEQALNASAASAQAQPVNAAPSAKTSLLSALPGVPVWRVAVPIAVVASALMSATAIMASLAAPTSASGWAEAPSNQASVDQQCLVRHALSKQSWLPRAGTPCWSAPQPQSTSASMGRMVRQLSRVRIL